MARARLIKPGFFANETLTETHPFGRLLFIGLWTVADKMGRIADRPKWIKGALFPYESVAVERLLNELQSLGFILRYEVDGQRYIQIVNFRKHQRPHQNEVESVIPPPHGWHDEEGSTTSDIGESTSDNGASASLGSDSGSDSGDHSDDPVAITGFRASAPTPVFRRYQEAQ